MPRNETAASVVLESLAFEFDRRQFEVDLSQPSNLYLTDDQSRNYEIATVYNKDYDESINMPIQLLLSRYRSEIFMSVDTKVDFIDLGPGFPDKSLSLVEYLIRVGVSVSYFPVDISSYFLKKSSDAARRINVPVTEVLTKFEDLSLIIDRYSDSSVDRIFFLGLTFCNFDLKHVCNILSSILRINDICLICSQSIASNPKSMLLPYLAEDVEKFTFGHMEYLGFKNNDFLYEPRFVSNCIETTFVSKYEIKTPIIVPSGSRFVTAKSFRNPIYLIEKELKNNLCHVRTYNDTNHGLYLIQVSGRLAQLPPPLPL